MANSNNSIGENTINEMTGSRDHSKVTAVSQGKKTSIGGQALIEGLMMVGPRRVAMAVRKADGSILVEEISQGRKMIFFEKVPFIRGGIRLFRQLITGTGAMMKSAELSEEPVAAPSAVQEGTSVPDAAEILPVIPASADANAAVSLPESLPDEERLANIATQARSAAQPAKPKEKVSRLDSFLEKNMNLMVLFSAILGILFGVVLFFLLPRLIVDLISHWIPASQKDSVGVTLILNLVEGIVRITIFIGYLAITSRVKEIARVWMYHGAEHKTIACYEAGEPLTVANIRKYSRFHPRCGTAFLFVVVIVSILVFAFAGLLIGINIWWLNSIIRLALVPLVAGIAYEIIHFTAKHDNFAICRSVSKPGMWMQRFTTREPDDGMIEVAIAAMQAVLPENKSEDNW